MFTRLQLIQVELLHGLSQVGQNRFTCSCLLGGVGEHLVEKTHRTQPLEWAEEEEQVVDTSTSQSPPPNSLQPSR